MVKFTTASVDDKYMHRRFSVIFNNIAANDEYKEFVEAFKHLTLTEIHGLEL